MLSRQAREVLKWCAGIASRLQKCVRPNSSLAVRRLAQINPASGLLGSAYLRVAMRPAR